MKKEISEFLTTEKICTLSFVSAHKSKSVIVFYAFNLDTNALYFQSSPDKAWVKAIHENSNLSGTIIKTGKNWFQQKGLSFEDELVEMFDDEIKRAKKAIEAKMPITAFATKTIYKILLTQVNLTSFQVGIPITYEWSRNDVNEPKF